MRLIWHPVDGPIKPNSPGNGGIGPGDDEFLVFWWGPNEEDNVEIDRWLGNQWKHRNPDFWAVIPLPTDS